MTVNLMCDGHHDEPRLIGSVGYIDDKGYAYCETCGPRYQGTMWRRCRKLRPHELRKLQRGETLPSYDRSGR